MNQDLMVSPPFRRQCESRCPAIQIFSEDPMLYALSIFLESKLKVALNDGTMASGRLDTINSDGMMLDGMRIPFSDCSMWLSRSKMGMATDIEAEMGIVKIVPGTSYGINHSGVVYAAFVGSLEEGVDEKSDYPILYGADENGNLEIYGAGKGVSGLYFGEVVKYHQDLGAGQIEPDAGAGSPSGQMIRFTAEDLTNLSPESCNTFAFHYRVSYSLSQSHGRSRKAENVYMVYEIPLHPKAEEDGGRGAEEVLRACAREAASQWNASTDIVNLDPLSPGLHYGIMFYYKPEYTYINLFNLYKYKPVYGELTPEENQAARLGSVIKEEDTFTPGVNPDTRTYVYLVSYGSGSHLDVHRAFPKSEVWMLRIVQNQMLIVSAPSQEQKDATLAADSSVAANPSAAAPASLSPIPEEPAETLELPPLQSGESYAVLNFYARSSQMTFFHRAYILGISKEDVRSLTTGRIFTPDLVVADANGVPQTPSKALNTLKNIYIVRIPVESGSAADGNVPIIQGTVSVIRSFVRKNYKQIRVVGNSVQLYGSNEAGIVRREALSGKTTYPDYVSGETLIVKTSSGRRTITYSGPDSLPSDASDRDGGVVRFGVLTGVFRDENTDALSGICLNHSIYFSIGSVGEQILNVIRTSPKRMLLTYSRIGEIVTADRVLPDDIWDLPWERDVVQRCVTSTAELSIVLESGGRHYQTTDTDGYVNSSARNGTLVRQPVFLKQIACPDWSTPASPQMLKVAAMIHCVHEMAFITYDQALDEYYAWRYNLRTNALGTIKRPVYGSEKLLAAAVNTHVEVDFAPYGPQEGTLISELPAEDGVAPDDMRMPQTSQEPSGDDVETELALRARSKSVPNVRAETTEIGIWLLRMTENNPRYREIRRYLVGGSQDAEEIQRIEANIPGLFASGGSEDMMIAAKLAELGTLSARFAKFRLPLGPQSTHYFLRRAFRSRVNEIVQSGDFRMGEFDTFMLPILNSDSTPEQRARDLYVFLLPCFNRSYNIKNEVLPNITRGSFASDTDPEKQEFVVKLKELVGEVNAAECDVVQFLSKIVAMDRSSFDFLCDVVFSENFSQTLRRNLLSECGVSGGAQDNQSLITALQERRQSCAKAEDRCRHLLESVARVEEAGLCDAIAEAQEPFLAVSDYVGQEDRENLRNLRGVCEDVVNSRRQLYADRMAKLVTLETSISRLRSDEDRHPTPAVVSLFFGSDLLKRIHQEIIDALNEMCKVPNSLPDVQCVANYPILFPNQSYFTLNLENGSVENEEEKDLLHRTARDLVVTLTPRSGIPSDNVTPQLKSSISLPSGERISLSVAIALDGISSGTVLKIGYEVAYQYPDSFQLDESGSAMTTVWGTGRRKGVLTLTVNDVPEKLEKRKRDAKNPYEDLVNTAVPSESPMYFGRIEEKKKLLKYLRNQSNRLVPGRTVFLYGQKQCGKTSFLNRIIGELRKDPDAVVLHSGNLFEDVCSSDVEYFQGFSGRLAATLLEKLIEALKKHQVPRLRELGEKYDVIIRPLDEDPLNEHLPQKVRLFNRLLQEVQKEDDERYRIVLVMDEFTLLCKAVKNQLNRDPACRMIPEFIRTYADKGFVLIVTGHDSMMNLLRELKIINRTAQTALVMHLSTLDVQAARMMIREPMEKAFQEKPYNTDSGKLAVRRLCDLSGQNPFYLMFLCNHMFKYYQAQVKGQMSDEDVNRMVRGIPDDELKRGKGLLFEPLLSEDFDDAKTTDQIFKYLCHVARETRHGSHACSQNRICPGMTAGDSRLIQNLLIERDVLWAKNGQIGIKVGLFREYVRRL